MNCYIDKYGNELHFKNPINLNHTYTWKYKDDNIDSFNFIRIDYLSSDQDDSTHLIHNNDGPAVIYNNGERWWCIDGILHREDGPAVERIYNLINYKNNMYFYKGQEVICENTKDYKRIIKMKAFV